MKFWKFEFGMRDLEGKCPLCTETVGKKMLKDHLVMKHSQNELAEFIALGVVGVA